MAEEAQSDTAAAPVDDRIFAVFAPDGTCEALFLMEAHAYDLPPNAVQISKETWSRFTSEPAFWRWDASAGEEVPYTPPPEVPQVPGSVSIAAWRSGLEFWENDDGSNRLDEVVASVDTMVKSTDPAARRLGQVARQQLNFSSNVELSKLLEIRAAFGFSPEECEESMWRGRQVELGDFSGVWPL